MSLIGDALRKARQQAAERDNERKGVLFSARIADAPTRSNLGLGIALGAAIAVVATVAGGVAVWWVLESADRSVPAVVPASVAESEAVPEAASETVDAAVAGTDTVTGTASAPAPAVTDTESDTGSDTDTTTDTVTDAVTVTDTGAASDTETGSIGNDREAEVYLMEADLGTAVLSLDYIVFRPDDPYAEVNGQEVHLGTVIEGFRVKAIQRDRVVLSDGRRNVVLRAP
ncbi:MAG: hypothetical protein V2I67_15540 [Thermoanaerobaculales bacterium]|jgi:hypothetical protein|nr:hypothetical protein [Thermoanaerobaculales bacterium]